MGNKKGKGWHEEPRRHELARQGIKTTMPRSQAMLKAPLANKATKLPIQFSITIPTTRFDKDISGTEKKKRVENTAKEFSDRFGGDTVIKGKGDYTTNGKLIREDVFIIESSMTTKDYLKNKKALEDFIKKKKVEWKQESIGYTFEEDFYIYPKNGI